MPFTYIRRAAVALALLTVAGCTVKSTEPPPLAGPSALALTLKVNAIPDSISQDGGSQSSVKVTAIGPDGKGLPGVPLRLDMMVGGVAQDYGTLSARSIVTNSDGVATAVYTAPPGPVNGVFGTCSGLPGNCVSIVATPTASNFTTVNPEQVLIRLVPTGVILPPVSVPTADFTISPTPVNFNIPSTFDASLSCGGPLVGGLCPSGISAISSYVWNFGDGATATGKTATHTYVASTTPATSFNVVLTVTNDRGLAASKPQVVSVNGSALATGDWVFSPLSVAIGDVVLFNAEAVRPPAGHFITQYNWNFGDGTTGSGQLTTHVFTGTNTFAVVLTVTDDSGQKTVLSHSVPVGTGAPVAAFTSSVADAATHTMAFDGSGSAATGKSTIATYQWAFGDGASTIPSTTATTNHRYLIAGSYTVRLTVVDTQGRTGSISTSVTVP